MCKTYHENNRFWGIYLLLVIELLEAAKQHVCPKDKIKIYTNTCIVDAKELKYVNRGLKWRQLPNFYHEMFDNTIDYISLLILNEPSDKLLYSFML